MTKSRTFTPGTTGWTEDDLYDPRIERLWERGRYEIVEGVLTKVPASYLDASIGLRRLVNQVERYLEHHCIQGDFAFAVDLVVNQIRVPRVDSVFLTPEQIAQQASIDAKRKRRPNVRYGRVRVVPELVIESISPGHELHDRQTKRQWYSAFGIPNYWLFDAYRRTLDCLRLKDSEYVADVSAKDLEQISPSMFPGLTIELGKIWM